MREEVQDGQIKGPSKFRGLDAIEPFYIDSTEPFSSFLSLSKHIAYVPFKLPVIHYLGYTRNRCYCFSIRLILTFFKIPIKLIVRWIPADPIRSFDYHSNEHYRANQNYY